MYMLCFASVVYEPHCEMIVFRVSFESILLNLNCTDYPEAMYLITIFSICRCYMNSLMRKHTFCICESPDQMGCNRYMEIAERQILSYLSLNLSCGYTYLKWATFNICENKDTDQLRSNPEADQCLSFCYIDSTEPRLPKYKISSLWPSPVAVQPGLCQTWSESTLLVFSHRGSSVLWSIASMKTCLKGVYWKPLAKTQQESTYNLQIPYKLSKMSCVARKHVFGVSDLVRHKVGFLVIEDG